MPLRRARTRSIELQPYQSCSFQAAEGTILHVESGLARITEAPIWLADTMVAKEQIIAAGATYVVQNQGWLRLTAERPQALRCIEYRPAPAVSRLVALLTRLGARRFRRKSACAAE